MPMQDEILDFWFAPHGSAEHGKTRELWFRKDASVDQAIRARFGGAVETALAGGSGEWTSPRGARVCSCSISLRATFTAKRPAPSPATSWRSAFPGPRSQTGTIDR